MDDLSTTCREPPGIAPPTPLSGSGFGGAYIVFKGPTRLLDNVVGIAGTSTEGEESAFAHAARAISIELE